MTDNPGVIVAAITPRGTRGGADLGAAFDLLDYWCAAGVGGIALFGATGEYPALTFDERTRLLSLAAKRTRVPLFAGVGSASLDASLALAHEALAAGVVGILLPPPHFFRYEQDDIREFYLEFAAEMGDGAAMFLSSAPSGASGMAVETALGLLQTGRFAGIEDASGSQESFACLMAAASEGSFRVMVGDDALFTSARRAGASAISPVACAVPELIVALDRAIAAGNQQEAGRLDEMLQEFIGWMRQFPQPAVVKVATGLRGLKTGPLAVPLPPGKQRKLDEFREWFQGWLPSV
jgi:4-hydroxy-tetrahydrodipicolinate synthase